MKEKVLKKWIFMKVFLTEAVTLKVFKRVLLIIGNDIK